MYDFHIQLLSGGSQDFDVDDLRNHTKYTGGYTESSRTVKLFWEVCVVASSWSFNSMHHRSWVQTYLGTMVQTPIGPLDGTNYSIDRV
jgi:hypothetical protein